MITQFISNLGSVFGKAIEEISGEKKGQVKHAKEKDDTSNIQSRAAEAENELVELEDLASDEELEVFSRIKKAEESLDEINNEDLELMLEHVKNDKDKEADDIPDEPKNDKNDNELEDDKLGELSNDKNDNKLDDDKLDELNNAPDEAKHDKKSH